LTADLYKQVKHLIPSHVGVILDKSCVKNPKKQELLLEETILKNSFIRSLYRDSSKYILKHLNYFQ